MALAVDAVEAPLPVTLDWMLTQTTTYALLRPRIMSATAAERAALLADGTRLTALRVSAHGPFAKAGGTFRPRRSGPTPPRSHLLVGGRVQPAAREIRFNSASRHPRGTAYL